MIKPISCSCGTRAWFAFARFHPVYRSRTAMAAAERLLARLRRPGLPRAPRDLRRATRPVTARRRGAAGPPVAPRPGAHACARVRVCATQSTHKTLTSLRQGSMIHVFDEDFSQRVEESFHEATWPDTSTSPNYQILASWTSVADRRRSRASSWSRTRSSRRWALRDAIESHPLLKHYMRCLTTADLIPAAYRPAGIDRPIRSGLS